VNPHFEIFKKQITNPIKFSWFMLTKLPSTWFAGLRIEKLTEHEASVSVKYKWFNKNPFRSVYVAILSMPAEVSTGILCMGALYKRNPSVSMLAVGMEGSFIKKATSKIVFTCSDGKEVNNAVEKAIATGESVTVTCHSVGTNEDGEIVAEFYFTWSFKARKSNPKTLKGL
jgi:hypothetical protein